MISQQNIPTHEPVIVIHSWADQRSFLTEGVFSETYYGDLINMLDRKNSNTFYIFDILSTISYPEALRKLSKIPYQGNLFENFLEFHDIIHAWHMARGRKNKETDRIFFLGHEISELLNEEYEKDRFENRAEVGALYYFAARRMAQQLNIKTFIYTFENHIWEKMTIEGIHESSPHTKIVGYAHSTVNKMYLGYSLSKHEKNSISLPDIILVNGPQAKVSLIESGFEDKDIQIIGSLRYGDLTFITKSDKPDIDTKILVVLSGNRDLSLEMIYKCVEAFRGIDNVSIVFKPHPILNPESMIKSVGNLPENFVFTSMPINTLFETAKLVIYCDSAASVEAASQGIPLLHIKSDFTIDMNIFEDVDIIQSVSSPQQIRLQSLKILSGKYPPFEEIQIYIKQIFSRVDDQKIMEIFS